MLSYSPFTVISHIPRFRPTSPGEHLWLSLRDMYMTGKFGEYPGSSIYELTNWVEPSGALAHYHAEVTVTSAVYKLMKAAKRIEDRDGLSGNNLHTHEGEEIFEQGIRRYMVESMGFAALDNGANRLIPNLILQAHSKTRAKINHNERDDTLDESSKYCEDGDIHCYACHATLWSSALGSPQTGIPLDHLWPRSLGGVSTAANLLPICDTCNGAKQDRASWAVFGVVQDYAIANRSADSILLIGLAHHHLAAIRYATSNRISLKEAYVALGPRTTVEYLDPLDGDHFFNRVAHDRNKYSTTW